MSKSETHSLFLEGLRTTTPAPKKTQVQKNTLHIPMCIRSPPQTLTRNETVNSRRKQQLQGRDSNRSHLSRWLCFQTAETVRSGSPCSAVRCRTRLVKRSSLNRRFCCTSRSIAHQLWKVALIARTICGTYNFQKGMAVLQDTLRHGSVDNLLHAGLPHPLLSNDSNGLRHRKIVKLLHGAHRLLLNLRRWNP